MKQVCCPKCGEPYKKSNMVFFSSKIGITCRSCYHDVPVKFWWVFLNIFIQIPVFLVLVVVSISILNLVLPMPESIAFGIILGMMFSFYLGVFAMSSNLRKEFKHQEPANQAIKRTE